MFEGYPNKVRVETGYGFTTSPKDTREREERSNRREREMYKREERYISP